MPQIPELPLADIHLQDAPSYFPLSLWGNLVLVAILLTIILIAFVLYRVYQKNTIRRVAQVTLSHINNKDGLAKINALLKRVAMSYSGRSEIAPLTGSAWFSYLDSCLIERYQGFSSQERLWLDALYRGCELTDNEFKRCKRQAKIWIRYARFESLEHGGIKQ